MKLRRLFTLLLATLTLFCAYACAPNELIPTAQALYVLEDGTILDPGSHGLVVESMDTKLLTKKSDILKALKYENEYFDEESYQHYQDFAFWKVTVKLKNNFPTDLYGLNFMLLSYDPEYTYFDQWWHHVGHTWTTEASDRPKGLGYGQIMIGAGKTYTYNFYYYTTAFGDDQPPKYLRIDWIEFWTKDDFFMDQPLQISPYFELDNYEKAGQIMGISTSDDSSGKDDHTDYYVTDITLNPVDAAEILKDDNVCTGSIHVYGSSFSEDDTLLELMVTIKNTSDADIQNPDLDLLFYNKDNNVVRRDYEYYCSGTVAAGAEATLSAGYYYAEDPYYIPYAVKETGGTHVFKTPATAHQATDIIAGEHTVSAGAYHTVYIKSDGRVAAFGRTSDNRCKVEGWRDIISVDASSHTVGLKSDGTVVATGPNRKKQCNVSTWKDIIAVAAGGEHTVGLKSDGTVVAVGNSAKKRLDVSKWKDIIAVDAGNATTYGLKADGTVVAAGSNSSGQTKITHWDDIVAISAGDRHMVGLKSDGTVVAAGGNSFGECDVESWTDIVAVAAGNQFTVGLKADGTVVATGLNKEGQCDVSDWADVVTISAGMHHVVGIRADGSYITAGSNGYGQCDLK